LTALVEWEGAERPAAVFKPSTKNTLIGAIAVLAVGALGIFGLTEPHDVFFGILSAFLVLLSAGGVLGVIAAFRGKTYIALLPEGILQRSISGWSFVPWEGIEAVGYSHVYWQTNLGLRTKEPPQAGGLLRSVPAFNRRFRGLGGGWDLGIPLWPTERSEELVALVRRCIAEPEARSRLGHPSPIP
jgi:hypothetical protein